MMLCSKTEETPCGYTMMLCSKTEETAYAACLRETKAQKYFCKTAAYEITAAAALVSYPEILCNTEIPGNAGSAPPSKSRKRCVPDSARRSRQ